MGTISTSRTFHDPYHARWPEKHIFDSLLTASSRGTGDTSRNTSASLRTQTGNFHAQTLPLQTPQGTSQDPSRKHISALKIRCQRWRVGSSPSPGTIF